MTGVAARDWRRWAFAFAMFGCAQFVGLTAVAMLVYPGGTREDPAATGYSFFSNFFSDLGRTVTYRDQPNTVSALLFFIALFLAGVALILFFAAMPRLFQRARASRWLSRIGSAIGVVSGVAYVGIACTPADRLLVPHVAFVLTAFSLFLPVAVLYTIAMFLDKRYPARFAFVFLAFAVVLAVYLGLLFAGPQPFTPEGLVIQATGQKIVVYAQIACMFLQAWGTWRMLRPEAF